MRVESRKSGWESKEWQGQKRVRVRAVRTMFHGSISWIQKAPPQAISRQSAPQVEYLVCRLSYDLGLTTVLDPRSRSLIKKLGRLGLKHNGLGLDPKDSVKILEH